MSYKAQQDDQHQRLIKPTEAATSLPATRVRLLLLMLRHHGGRNRRRRTRQPHASLWIDYRDGIASAESGRLMDLHLLLVLIT